MGEASVLNAVIPVNTNDLMSKYVEGIKQEYDVSVKGEQQECVVCGGRSVDALHIHETTTACGTLLANFLAKYTPSEGALGASISKLVCRNCFELIDLLERAELEYLKLKESFEAIISKNPLFELAASAAAVKCEAVGVECGGDSDDEPLANTKKKRTRKVVSRKKKVQSTAKRKTLTKRSRKDSWDDDDFASGMDQGTNDEESILPDVKREDSQESSSSSHLANGLSSMLKVEVDDDASATYCPDRPVTSRRRGRPPRPAGTRARKVHLVEVQPAPPKKKPVHQCDQCDAKYTSLKRFELHLEKHTGGKPPYICEVCGARYKHKRACDVHVLLHRGVSDWKCAECDKLFPSKAALQRHNNIHTGKLNYQCDLCGKSFIHTSSFKMHKLSHSGVKPHACDVCGLALMTRSHLKRHKRVHSGEKRHECKVCGKRFSERYNLLAHSKMHELSGEAPPSAAPPAPRRRLFRCNFCIERFERRYMLERHMSVEHGRALERAPATPRNTMSKLLKAQAANRQTAPLPLPIPPHTAAQHPDPVHTPNSQVVETKEERSPESRAPIFSHKPQITVTGSSWPSAYVAGEFLRHDFPH